MKKTKIIIPAMGMLLLGTAASVTGTVAWFSINNSVSVTGMTVHTQVSSNLQIAASTAGTTSAGLAAFGNDAEQTVSGLLEPVSTVNGVNFFYNLTDNAKSDGSRDDTDVDYVAYDPADTEDFNDNYGTTGAVGYVDYVLELKADNTNNTAWYINLDKLHLIYDGINTTNAFRVAYFYQTTASISAVGVPTYNAAMNLVGSKLISPAGIVHQATGMAVSDVDEVTAVTYSSAAADTALSAAPKTTTFYKVTLRLYIEGEDNTCNNSTFLNLTENWAFNVSWKLESASTNSVYNLSKFSSASAGEPAKTWYYDGAYVWDDLAKLGKVDQGTAIASADAAVKAAFGYGA